MHAQPIIHRSKARPTSLVSRYYTMHVLLDDSVEAYAPTLALEKERRRIELDPWRIHFRAVKNRTSSIGTKHLHSLSRRTNHSLLERDRIGKRDPFRTFRAIADGFALKKRQRNAHQSMATPIQILLSRAISLPCGPQLAAPCEDVCSRHRLR